MHRVLVLGVPRSGTTWIGEVLGHTDDAVYVHEPDGVHEPFAFRAKTALPLGGWLPAGADGPRDYERLWDGAFLGGAKAGTIADHLARRTYARVSAATRAEVRAGGRAPLALQIAVSTARPRVAAPAARHTVVKSVDAALSAEWIAARWRPDVVVVRRDLRSVLASWLSLGMRGPREPAYNAIAAFATDRWGVELPSFEASVLERAASVCSVWSLALVDAAGRHGWQVVSHDDVVLDPVPRLRELADALHLRWGPTTDAFVEATNRPGEGYATQRVADELVDSWKRRLDADQIAAIESVLARFPADLVDR